MIEYLELYPLKARKNLLYFGYDECEIKVLENIGFDVLSTCYPNAKHRYYKNFVEKHHPGHSIMRIDSEFAKLFDVVISKHHRENLLLNLNKLAGKLCVLRTIGLNPLHAERETKVLINNGVKVVRSSIYERRSLEYAGENDVIRYPVDCGKFYGWTGKEKIVFNAGPTDQLFYELTKYFEVNTLSGIDNIRRSRVYFAVAHRPFSLAYGFSEALMMGIPIVAIGPGKDKEFEYHEILENGLSGFWSEDAEEIKKYIRKLLFDYELAKKISVAGRKKAIEVFGFANISKKWNNFFKEHLT